MENMEDRINKFFDEKMIVQHSIEKGKVWIECSVCGEIFKTATPTKVIEHILDVHEAEL